jgi:DNA-binding YbaB/EbfC family protein
LRVGAAAGLLDERMEVSMAKGFKAPKMNNNPMGMMGQIQKLQEQIAQVQEQLSHETVSASAGGGAVKITVTGDQRCAGVEIDPALLQDADVEMMQDLILTAFNNALEASRAMAAERLGPLAGGLPF